MRGITTTLTGRVVSVALSAALLLGNLGAGGVSAFAADEQPGAPGTDLQRSTTISATVVREAVELEDESTKVFELSDGTFEGRTYAAPVQSEVASDVFVPVDTDLVPADGPGQLQTLACPTEMTFASAASGRAQVTAEREGVRVSLDLVGALEPDPVAIGDKVTYSLVAPGTNLVYDVTATGLKETLLLGSAQAPSQFAFDMQVEGGQLKSFFGGSLAIVKAGTSATVFSVGSLSVCDAKGVRCESGTTEVVDMGQGRHRFIYTVPAEWLASPERVFPVYVDPSLAVDKDTYVSEYYPNTSYITDPDLEMGRPSGASNDDNRALVRFDTSAIKDAYVHDATFQTYLNFINGASSSRTYLSRINAQYWNPGSITWNTKPSSATTVTSQLVSGLGWYYWDITSLAQEWVRPLAPVSWASNSLQMSQAEDGSQGSVHYKRFYSANHATYQPYTMWHYTVPSVSTSTNASSYDLSGDDVVYATATLDSGYLDEVRSFEIDINGAESGASRKRGHMAWFASQPATSTGFTSIACSSGGYMGYETSDTAFTDPQLSSCSISDAGSVRTFTFAFKVKPSWGTETQSNSVDYRLKMGTTSDTFDTGWKNGSSTFSVAPATVDDVSVTTTASAGWFTETDSNADGLPDNTNDSNASGRGAIQMSWASKAGAAGYDVYLFDGNAYSHVATLTGAASTSWSSAGAGLFPSDSWIASNASSLASGAPAIQAGNGLDLRDDPRVLYQATPGTGSDDLGGYLLKVVPYRAAPRDGDATSSPVVGVTLDDRTVGLSDDVRHTYIELDDTSGGSSALVADTAALILDATDLSLETYGPEAALSRHYNSSNAGTGSFASGWRFGFEESLVVSGTVATWTDEAGDSHCFTSRAGTWYPPAGLVATLAQPGDGTTVLTFSGAEQSIFDATSGALKSERDSNDNTVTYATVGSNLEITAANGNKITVTRSGSVVTGASTTGGGLTRSISYAASGATATVTTSYSDGTTGLAVGYLYSGTATSTASRVVRVSIPGASGLAGQGAWDYSYSGSWLATITGPLFDDSNRAVSRVIYDFDSGLSRVTVSRDGVQVAAAAAAVDEHWWLNASGTLARHADKHVAGAAEPTTAYTYSPEGFQASSLGPLGASSVSLLDAHGNALRTRDQDGDEVVSTYDAADRVLTRTHELGSTTTSVYDARGNLLTEERVLNESEKSHVGCGYDSYGRKTSEVTSLTASTVATTSYSYGQPFASPTTTTRWARLASGAGLTQIVESAAFDSFGNQTSSTDASGAISTSTFDGAGRQLSSTNPVAVTENHRYDALGNEIATWRSAPGTAAVTGYIAKTVDAYGRTRSEAVCDGSGGAGAAPSAVVRTTDRTFDSLGRELTSHDSLTSGNTAKTEYDALGNATKSFDDGIVAYDELRSTRAAFDLAGRETSSLAPGADTSPTLTSYLSGGEIASQTSPEGVVTTFRYDSAGNQIEADSSQDGVTTTEYDLSGRTVATVKDSGTENEARTDYAFDLAGRQVSSGAGGSPATVTSYNELGWALSTAEADGVETSSTLDACGRTVRESEAGSATVTTYRSDGSTVKVVGPAPDLRSNETSFDAFGRAREVTQTNPAGVAKHVIITFDALDRVVVTSDTVAGVKTSVAYPTHAGGSTTQTVTYASITTTIIVDSAGLERSRSSAATYLPAGILRASCARDSALRPTGWKVTLAGSGLSSSTVGYDDAGRTTTLSAPGLTASYSYGPDGRKAQDAAIAGPGGITKSLDATYRYGSDGRLATATVAGATDAFVFDAAGNIARIHTVGADLGAAFDYDSANRLVASTDTAGVATRYGWDTERGWRTSSKRGSDTSVTMSYTQGSRMASWIDRNAGRETTATYQFDASGQRTTSVIARTGSPNTTQTINWNYEGLTLLSVSSVTKSATSTVSQWQLVYLYDESARAYAGIYREGTSTLGAALPFAIGTTDRGDIVSLVASNSAAFATYSYDSWGNPIDTSTQAGGSVTASVAANIANRQPLRYAGYCWDTESKMYYCSARTYDPATRQFTSKDPAKAGGEESAFQYCGGEPVGGVDPSGLDVWGYGHYGDGFYRQLTPPVKHWKWYEIDFNPRGGTPIDLKTGVSIRWSLEWSTVSIKRCARCHPSAMNWKAKRRAGAAEYAFVQVDLKNKAPVPQAVALSAIAKWKVSDRDSKFTSQTVHLKSFQSLHAVLRSPRAPDGDMIYAAQLTAAVKGVSPQLGKATAWAVRR